MRDLALKQAGESTSDRLADFYIRYLPMGRGLGYLLTGNREEAEDLAQEAFVRVAGRFGHIRSADSFEAYLRKTIVNLFLSQVRRRRLERRQLERERLEVGRRTALAAASGNDDPSRQALWTIMQRLPFRQRAVVVLRYYEDLSERQVAETLRTSVPAVKSLLKRAMETLRANIGGEDW